MVYRRSTGALGRAQAPSVKSTSIPASVGGVNALDSLMAMPPQDCLFSYNLMPVEYGLRVRNGYEEWANGAVGDIRTVIGYESDDTSLVNDKLWGVTENGIYDMTVFGTTVPVQDVVFGVTGVDSGYGVTAAFDTDASDHYLFYADSRNGVYQYTEASGWTVPVGWTYEDPLNVGVQIPFPVEDVAFIMIHKLRIWVILESSSEAWYLPLYSIAGELKVFSFGSKLVRGGALMGLYDWTLDGGDGVDDYLIGVGRAGDLVIYRGADPEASDWQQVGSWFIGTVPSSRRLAAQYGGELYVLSTFGITSVGDLLRGVDVSATNQSPSAKVNRFLRHDVEAGKDRHEWALYTYPADGFLQIVTPEPNGSDFVQYNQNLTTKAWGFWRSVPAISADTWNGAYYIGSKAGVLYEYTGDRDGRTLVGGLGDAIEFETLTSYSGLGSHGNYKLAGLVRTITISEGPFAYNTKVLYDYELEPPEFTTDILTGDTSPNLWDSAIWDAALWDYVREANSRVLGSLGMGRAIAVYLKGSTIGRLNVVGWDVMLTEGGLL